MFIRRIFLGLLLLQSSLAFSNLFSQKAAFLPADQAFVFSHEHSGGKLTLEWQIAEGYYLYKKEISVQGEGIGKPELPAGEQYHDEFFGDVEIFRRQLQLTLPIAANSQRLEVRYQGCTEGFCYPPETVNIALGEPNSAEQAVNFPQKIATPNAEQHQLAEQLAANRFSIFWFFALGLGLAFTPCVLPMLPLLSAIVIGKQNRPNNARAFGLSLLYVQGMALTYTLLGLAVAAIGLPFQIALQSPPVLIGFAVLFTLLALSMFGLFSLELPHSWQQKLNALSQKQQGGAFGGVFVMGMLAGLIASPCTTAPLSGALLYVAQSGDLLTGGLALYLLALGMGLPLVLITLFGNNILPKSGDWLLKVKTLFGFVMLALPIFLLARLMPEWEAPMWAALAIAFLIWLYEQLNRKGLWFKLLKALLLVAIAFSAKPFTDLIWQPSAQNIAPQSHFARIHSLAELNQKLIENRGKKVMLDLYADWCVACKEFEKYTFSDPKIKAKLNEMAVFQIDMTKNSAENDELMKKFQILGLPTILFFDEQGNELSPKRVTGFMATERFLDWLNSL